MDIASEVQNGSGRSWHDLPYLNARLDPGRMTNAQWVYMRQQQTKWLAPQIMGSILIALHRKHGFGYERCARVYQQIQEIEAEYRYDPKKIKAACISVRARLSYKLTLSTLKYLQDKCGYVKHVYEGGANDEGFPYCTHGWILSKKWIEENKERVERRQEEEYERLDRILREPVAILEKENA